MQTTQTANYRLQLTLTENQPLLEFNSWFVFSTYLVHYYWYLALRTQHFLHRLNFFQTRALFIKMKGALKGDTDDK